MFVQGWRTRLRAASLRVEEDRSEASRGSETLSIPASARQRWSTSTAATRSGEGAGGGPSRKWRERKSVYWSG